MRLLFAGLLLFVLSLVASPAYAARAIVEKSTIEFTATQMGVPVTGLFKKFDADVIVDTNDLKRSRAVVTIYMDGFDGGSDEANTELKRKTWFDSASHPEAKFVSTAVSSLGPGRYRTAGKLTIKGKTRDAAADFTAVQKSGEWVIAGKFKINRLDFNVGEGVWADTDTVADEVELRFELYVPAEGTKKEGGKKR